MNETNATGYFGRASGGGHKALATKVHYVKSDGKCACGYKPHKTLKFQWCADDVAYEYIDCPRCRKLLKAEKWMITQKVLARRRKCNTPL